MQKFKKHSDELKKDSLDTLRESFHNVQSVEQVQEEEISFDWKHEEQEQEQEQEQTGTRIVKLNVGQVSSCGCGGSTTIEVYRTVPMDSPLNNGDTVDEFEDEDTLIE